MNQITQKTAILGGLLLVVLSGCKTIYEGKYDWDEGWKQGEVKELGKYSELTNYASSDCVKSEGLPGNTAAAVIRYRNWKYQSSRVVPLPEQGDFSVGTAVYINTKTCAQPLQLRSPK